MLPEEYRKEKATLTRKNFEAQGYKGGDVVTTIGGKGITLDELTKRLEGGVDETDPNVIEFRKATEIQAQANEALGKLNVEQAIIIQDAMKSLEFFLRDEFPNILSKANADSQTDAQTKPQTKPQEKPQASQETQDALKQAKATQQARKDAETKAKDAYKAESGIGPAGGMAKKAAQNKAAEATAARKAADANVASLEAKANAELEESAKQQKAQEEERKASEEAAKVKQKEADKAKSQEVINRNKTTRDGARPRMVGENETPSERKQRVEETYGRLKQQQNTVAPIQAPPPPGATAQTQKSKEQLYNERASKEGFGSYETITKRQEEINKEIEKKQKIVAGKKKMLQAAKFAAMQATDENGKAKYEGKEGYKESPAYKKAEEALAQAEAGLASSQNDYKTNEGTIARFTAPTPTTVSVASNPKPEVGIQSRNTNMQQPAGMFGNIPYSGDTRTPQDPDNLRLPNNSSAPIPVTKPERTSEQTTPYNSEDKKLVNAQMITIDPESITALNTFNANFSKYVTDLINFEFPKIPEKIDVVLSNTEHTVEVRFTGSAALEKLNGDLQKTALALVQPELAKLRDEIAAAMGPSGGVKNSAAMGQRTPNSGK
jgi:chemotaxis protein histidine kinase CheA